MQCVLAGVNPALRAEDLPEEEKGPPVPDELSAFELRGHLAKWRPSGNIDERDRRTLAR